MFTGQYFDAAKYFEKFHALSLGKPHWCMDDGKTLHSEACNQLSLIYTMIAKKFEASGERENYRYYLQLAYDKANEGRFIQQFVEMSSKTWFYFSFLVVQQHSAVTRPETQVLKLALLFNPSQILFVDVQICSVGIV